MGWRDDVAYTGGEEMKFKRGSYYIGDLSYVLPVKDWNTAVGHGGDESFKLRGKDVFFAGTRHGDGEYHDVDENRYAVDTGTIGIAPVSICLKGRLKEIVSKKLGRIVRFNDPFEVSAEVGVFRFGHIVIDTDPEDDEEACDCDCCPH